MQWNMSAWSIRKPIPSIVLFIVLMVLAVNFVGDGLRDAFDPRAIHHER